MAHRIPKSPPSLDNPPPSRSSTSYRASNRPPSHSPNASRTHHRGPLPLMIPNSSRQSSPPPALPPPTFLRDIHEGRDLAWEWGNPGQKVELPSRAVSPGTDPWGRRESREQRPTTSELWESRRRESSASTSTQMSPGTDTFDMNLRDEGYGSIRTDVGFSQLQGETSLELRNRKDSSHKYDNLLKARIGRPKTPTRTSTSGSFDNSPAALGSRTTSQATRPPQLKTLSISDHSHSASSESPYKLMSPFSNKFAHSPQSSAVSPSFLSSANSFATESHRSPIFDTTESVASSHTSLGGSLLSEMAGEAKFPRVNLKPGSSRSKPTDSNLSLAMMAVSKANSAAAAQASSSSSVSSSSLSSSALSSGLSAKQPHSHSHPHLHSQSHSRGGGGLVGRRPGMFNRASFEPGILATNESDAGDPPLPLPLLPESGGDSGMRHSHQLDDYPPQTNSNPTFPRLHSQSSRSGMKRRASSPPDEPSHDDRQASSAQTPQQQGPTSEQQRRTPGQQHPLAKRASPSFNHPAAHQNFSSYSSNSAVGLSANGSYASSFPVAAGNVATTSSSAQDRLSPAAMAQSSKQESHASPYMSSLSLDPGLQGQDSQGPSQFSLDVTQQLAAAAAQKVSAENASRMQQQNQPKHSASHHICDCCPKKPKKFDTLEELRQHQAEKQYVCQYCHNRFKNKNEAERHQNSLHLRRHSWSCATLERNFEAAFHPCTATPPNASSHTQPTHPPGTIAETDVCGYCGEEFPNLPQPDWLARGEHLTNVHKFSECNQSKKFYRADHFRQHLKHSHGGTSGKWTNMLEAACMKEEPPVTPEAQNQEQIRLQQQQQAQVAHAAQAAQAAAQQAQQAVQQAQAQAQAKAEAPALTQYQAAQLQGASGAPVANMMGQSGLRQGPYPAMPMGHANHSGELQYSTIPEESPK